MKKLAVLVCFALACTFSSCASAPTTNEVSSCVFQDEEATITVMHDGQEVGFCCKKCQAKWDGMSDEEKAKALAKK